MNELKCTLWLTGGLEKTRNKHSSSNKNLNWSNWPAHTFLTEHVIRRHLNLTACVLTLIPPFTYWKNDMRFDCGVWCFKLLRSNFHLRFIFSYSTHLFTCAYTKKNSRPAETNKFFGYVVAAFSPFSIVSGV